MTPMKIVKTGSEAREALIRGADTLADAVKLTLGPSGYNAILGPKGGALTRITNDGVSIAREITCEDEIEDLGRATLHEAAAKANEEAGDGTTTAITLAQAILHSLSEYFGSGAVIGNKKSVREIRDMVKQESEKVVEALKAMARPVASREELIQVAKIAVEDDTLAELIGGAQWDVGASGTLLPEISNDREDSIETVAGIRIDNGFGTSLAINNQEKQTLEVRDVQIIMTNHTLQKIQPLASILDAILKTGKREVIIMARGFTDQCIKDIMENVKQGNNFYPINAPYVDQDEIMLDLAAALGGRYINSADSKLEDVQLSDVGFAANVVAGRWSAVFTRPKDEDADARIAARLEVLNQKLSGILSPFERKQIEDRVAQLTNGFAIVKVTGDSLAERNYKKDKVDDCVNAVKAALQEGTVPGGGLALMRISSDLLDNALRAPYAQIQENAGGLEIDPEVVRDPVKVTRIAFQKAVSVATQLATAGIAVAEKRKKEKAEEND